MATYDENAVAKLKHLGALAQKTKAAIDAVDSKYAKAFQSLSVSGNTVSFFASTDGTGTAVATLDFPEELFLQQAGTEIVENFAWSAVAYPNSTNPSLEGKTVLVLAVKGDATNPTVKYSFVDMAKVARAINAGDNSINVNGNTLSVKISAVTGNLLELKSDGLFVGSDDTKVDKVEGKQLSTEDYTTAEKTKLAGVETGAQVNAIESVSVDGTALAIANKGVNIDLSGKANKAANPTAGHIATLDASGNPTDSGYTFATDSDVNTMLTDIFGA